MAQHRVSTRRRHRKSDVIVLVIFKLETNICTSQFSLSLPRVSSRVEMKILFERIPDYKTSSNTDVSWNLMKITFLVTRGCIKSVCNWFSFPKESDFEKELEKEQEACNRWNISQPIEQSKEADDSFEDMCQYACYTCSYSHYHSPPKVSYPTTASNI